MPCFYKFCLLFDLEELITRDHIVASLVGESKPPVNYYSDFKNLFQFLTLLLNN